MSKFHILGCVAALVIGCSSSTDYAASDIASSMPEGSMEGSAWQAVDALVRVDAFDDAELSVELIASDIEQCAFSTPSEGGTILFSIPRMEGEYPLSFDFTSGQTITFSPGPGQNVIAVDGLVVVEALSETEVTIGLIADAGQSSINGRFTTQICD